MNADVDSGENPIKWPRLFIKLSISKIQKFIIK